MKSMFVSELCDVWPNRERRANEDRQGRPASKVYSEIQDVMESPV